MPEDKPETDLIMIATGTGIAPYRSFARRLFAEATPAREAYKGQAWLFLGVANSDALLYDAEWQAILKEYPDNFRLDYALSREQTNKDGGKMYIQDKVGVRRGVVWCGVVWCLWLGCCCCCWRRCLLVFVFPRLSLLLVCLYICMIAHAVAVTQLGS